MPTNNEQPGVVFYWRNPETGELIPLEEHPGEGLFNIIADTTKMVEKCFDGSVEMTHRMLMSLKDYIEVCRGMMPNNWLKMHGYPKRRRMYK